MIPIAEALALLCTLSMYGNAPRAALTSDYERSAIAGLQGDTAGRAKARRPLLPASLWTTIQGDTAEHGIKVLLIEDDPTDGFLLQETLAATKFVSFLMPGLTERTQPVRVAPILRQVRN